MAFISVAPHGEDALLWPVLGHVEPGRYIDVGVRDPDRDSVTKAFYERGWRGLNLAASREGLVLSRQFRPDDVNLEPSIRLGDAWRSHVEGEIHLLSVGPGADERTVLASLDFGHQRPWIVVLSGVADRREPNSADCQDSLTVAGYALTHRTDASRIYVAQERAGLFNALATGGASIVDALSGHATAEESRMLRRQRDALLAIVSSRNGAFDASRHRHLEPYLDGPIPTLGAPASQLCTDSQLEEPLYRRWCGLLRESPCAHRKQWEFVYIMQALWSRGLLKPGARGLGFGCGNEPLAAAIAAYGCEVVATDLDPDDQRSKDWRETDQHAEGRVEALNSRRICTPDRFAKLVTYRNVDMNRIPEDLRDFDFTWSSCALEHIGSIRHGLDFIHNSMRCLKPGGWAIHTTEFNLTSNDATLESAGLSYFRVFDLETVAAELTQQGHAVEPFNFNPGKALLDQYVDVPPFEFSVHLRLRALDHTITSVGLLVRKATTPGIEPRASLDDSHARALESRVAGIEADPHDVANFIEAARLLDAVGDGGRARQCLEVGLDQNPRAHALWQELVHWSASRGDAAGAAMDARHALAQLPAGGHGDWHVRVATACLARGAVDDARDVLERGAAFFPDHARLRQLTAALPLGMLLGFTVVQTRA